MMKVSVVMSTYNGRRYLPEMLDSLRKQTREIDELLIYDDCSRDETASYIKGYIEEYKIENWKIAVNEANVGWEQNFFQGLKNATGDVIYLCDQDDIWHEDRVEKMTKSFEENDDIWLMVSGYNAFTENGGKMVFQHHVKTENKSLVSRVVFDKHYYLIHRPGCTMAFRNNLLPLFNVNWKEGTPHDAVLWVLSSLIGKLYLYDETFIKYRRHETNASRAINHNYSYKINEVARTRWINQWYVMSEYYDPDKKVLIDRINKFCDLRKIFLTEKGLFAWLKLFRYRDLYFTKKQYWAEGYYFLVQSKK